MTEQTQPTDAREPCPFCGSSRIGVHRHKQRRAVGYKAMCLDCGVTQSGVAYPDIAQATSAWNTRAKWGTPAGAGEPQPSSEGPPEVWLQLHCDCLPHERTEPVDYTGGDVTWCWHAIHSDDVRYVRADLATTQQPTQAQAGADAVVEQVANGLRRYGLTLVKTASGYDVLSLRDVAANGIKGADHD